MAENDTKHNDEYKNLHHPIFRNKEQMVSMKTYFKWLRM